MKTVIIALSLLVLGTAACSKAPTPTRPTPAPPVPAKPPVETAPVETAPATKPAPAASKPALDAVRTLALEVAMERVNDAGLEASLESWADGKTVNFDHVIKRTGVFLDVAPKIKWEDSKKRERNPADHDRLVLESIEKAAAVIEAARAKNADLVRTLSDELLQRCVDCHTKYK